MSTSEVDPRESLGQTVTTICIVCGILTGIVISMRLFTRCYIIKSVGAEDIFMTIAALLSLAFIAASILAVRHGLGDHFQVVLLRGPDNLTRYAQIIWLSSLFYNSCLGCIKVSVLTLYSRLGDPRLRRLALVVAAVVTCHTTANILTCIFQCSPIKAAWDPTITRKKCVNINAFYLANSALNILTDLLTYTLPIPLVLRLRIPLKQKWALAVIMCLGLLACLSSIIRITVIPQLLTSDDPTWDISPGMYWSVIEVNVGIVAACIPSFKALAKRFLPRILGEYSSKNIETGTEPKHKSVGPSYAFSQDEEANASLAESLPPQTEEESWHQEYDFSMAEMKTTIKQDTPSTESQEKHVPDGKIVATTRITTHTEAY